MRRLYPTLWSSSTLAVVVGRRIRDYRAEKGLSVRDVAAYLAVPEGWVRDYEAGVRLARTYTLYQLAHLFGVGLSALVDEEPAEKPLTDSLLLKALRRLQKLGTEDRQAVSAFLDSIITALIKFRKASGGWD